MVQAGLPTLRCRTLLTPARHSRRLREAKPSIAAASLLVLLLLLTGCSGGVLDPQGPIGAANRQILLNALGIMLVIVVPTLGGTLFFAWWYRASNDSARY